MTTENAPKPEPQSKSDPKPERKSEPEPKLDPKPELKHKPNEPIRDKLNTPNTNPEPYRLAKDIYIPLVVAIIGFLGLVIAAGIEHFDKIYGFISKPNPITGVEITATAQYAADPTATSQQVLAAATVTLPAPTLTEPIPANTAPIPTLMNSAPSFTGMGYDFETGKQGWGVDTSNPIDAALSVTTEQHRSGAQALQLSTEIYGPNEQNNSYLYVDMTTNEPLNAEDSAPYDLTGYLVSCYVKFSEEFLASQGGNGYIQMFVRDDNFGKSTGQAKGNNSVVNSGDWEKLTIRLGDPNNVNEGAFDAANVYQFGIEFHPDSGDPNTGTGMIWVDDCQLEKP